MMFFFLTLLAPLHANTEGVSGSRTIPAYKVVSDNFDTYHLDFSDFVEWNQHKDFTSYEECVAECEMRGDDCWGFQMVDEYCDYIITSEPPADAYVYTSHLAHKVYQKLTQTWDEELERCMGLEYHWGKTSAEECQMECALDASCEVYQWYWNTWQIEAGVGECWRGKSNDCSNSHAIEKFEVREGYRKQERSPSSSSAVPTSVPTFSSTSSDVPTSVPTFSSTSAVPTSVPTFSSTTSSPTSPDSVFGEQELGYCVDSLGADQNAHVTYASEKFGNADGCLAWCETTLSATACEYHSSGLCSVHEGDVVHGNGVEGHWCYVRTFKIHESSTATDAPIVPASGSIRRLLRRESSSSSSSSSEE